MTDTSFEQSAIRGSNPLKAALKPGLKHHKGILARRMRAFSSMSFKKILSHGRYESPRKQIGSQHREDDRLRHWYEEITGYPGEQKHGHEDDTDAQC